MVVSVFSYLPWFEIFYNFLNALAEIFNRSSGESDLEAFLRAAYTQEVPAATVPVTIIANQDVSLKCSIVFKLFWVFVLICGHYILY